MKCVVYAIYFYLVNCSLFFVIVFNIGGATRLEDITDYYRQKGVCTGEECDRFMAQVIATTSIIMLLIYLKVLRSAGIEIISSN